MKTNSKINMFFLFTMGLGVVESHAQYLDQNNTEELEKFKHLTPADNKAKEQRKAEAKLKEERALKDKQNFDKIILALGENNFFDEKPKEKLIDEIRKSYSSYTEDEKAQLASLMDSKSPSAFVANVASVFLENKWNSGMTSENSIEHNTDILRAWAKIDPEAGAALFRMIIEISEDRTKYGSIQTPFYQLQHLLSAGVDPNVKLSPNGTHTMLSWLEDNLDPDERLNMMKILLENGAFEKKLVDTFTQKINDSKEFEALLRNTTLSSKNLTAHKDCENKKIALYLRVHSPGKTVSLDSGNLADKIDFAYKSHISTYSSVEECKRKHSELQTVLNLSRTHPFGIGVNSVDDWYPTSKETIAEEPKASTTSGSNH